MKFLDNPLVDIYISTWDQSEIKNELMNINSFSAVSTEEILADVGKHAIIEVEPVAGFVEQKYNSKMIHRWKSGFNLIKTSGINYDYILCVRPDLFFADTPLNIFDNLSVYDDGIGFAWASSLDKNKMPDIAFISSFCIIEKLFNTLKISDWVNSPESDWHSWWYHFTKSVSNNPFNLDQLNYCTFGRFYINKDSNFAEAISIQHDWRDSVVINQVRLYGKTLVEQKIWNPEIVRNALTKLKSKYFEKYK
jgi:hypothetical protein